VEVLAVPVRCSYILRETTFDAQGMHVLPAPRQSDALLSHSTDKLLGCHRDPLGEWESLGNPCVSRSYILRETTFHAQATHVLPLPGQPGRFIFLADRWFPQALGMSRWAADTCAYAK